MGAGYGSVMAAQAAIVASDTFCPRCKCLARKLGFIHYASGDKIQRWHCKSCQHVFVNEAERAAVPRIRPGPKPIAPPPPPNGTQPIIAGTWNIPERLGQSLSAMFQASTGFRPDELTLDLFVSEILTSQIADFRLYRRDELFHSFGRPPRKVLDPCKVIRSGD
jgi:hypothetical protein